MSSSIRVLGSLEYWLIRQPVLPSPNRAIPARTSSRRIGGLPLPQVPAVPPDGRFPQTSPRGTPELAPAPRHRTLPVVVIIGHRPTGLEARSADSARPLRDACLEMTTVTRADRRGRGH